tara:strand:+ start:2521 stop:4731 length:2211 start_codon:yes stop_codon:yes gene_type:complete
VAFDTSTDDKIESRKDYADTPAGKYKYWATELTISKKAREPWWKKADKIVNRFIGKQNQGTAPTDEINGFNLNLFHSNVKTLGDMLYGNTPKIDVSRRYAQPNDDVGRVSAEIMERLLNLDIANNGAEIDAVFRATLQDRLLSGLGCAKVGYTFESEETPILDEMGTPTGETEEKLISEDAPIDYYYFGDILWGWCRTWDKMPWLAFRSYVSKDDAGERWGEDVAEELTYKKQTKKTSDEGVEDDTNDSAWMRAEIWEIWDKDTKKVCWLSLGYDKTLEEKDDILEIPSFWPVPPFFIANVTTSLYTPTPDYTLAQDLYNEIDKLQTRIAVITEAVRVVGVYNASADNLKSMFNQGNDNDLIPVENWALFGENGGLAGQIQWLPLSDIVNSLRELITVRDQTIGLLQQTTGMTDIAKGGLNNQYEGVGQTDAKMKFGSVRIQALQDQFARFASDLMQIKAEVISRHFSPETIFKRANMEFSYDIDLVGPAIELIKDTQQAKLRIEIRPESVAMVDFQALKTERTDYLNAVAMFMQSAAPIIEADPATKSFMLQLLQWGLAGFKGSSEIEGVIDKAISASQEAEKEQEGQEEPSPEAMAMQAEQQKQQGALGILQAKAEADMQLRQMDMQSDIQTSQATHQMKMAEINAAAQAKIAEIQVSLQSDLLKEQAQTQSNIASTNANVDGEIRKDVLEFEIDMAKEEAKTTAEIEKIAASAMADIESQTVAAALAPEPKGE